MVSRPFVPRHGGDRTATVVEHDHRARAERAAGALQMFEVHRNVEVGGLQKAGRAAARL